MTRLGMVGPTGTGVHVFWDALKRAESAIREISVFDASSYTSRIVGEADPFHPSDWLNGSD
jgi:3-oxoacyl-(acyl-carrier-protein) synthase